MTHGSGIFPLDEVRFYRDDELGGLEVRLARYHAFSFAPHWHDTYSIGAALDGASQCIDRRDDTEVLAGEIFLLNPGQVHTGSPNRDKGISYFMFSVEADWLRAVLRHASDRDIPCPEFSRIVIRDPQLFRRLVRFYRTVAGRHDRLARDSASVDTVAGLFVSAGVLRPNPLRPGAERAAVTRAKDFLAANLGDKITLDDLSLAAGLSGYHLLRVFKQETGTTPHLYLSGLRIERARRLLRAGLPPAQVAHDTGFFDQSHFANTFKRFMGATPRQYAAS
jgi:AraC-like DNA-binding protein